MSQNKFLKCNCAQCGGHIEFPAEGVGLTIPCPHCGVETELNLESPEPTSAGSSRSLKWVMAGVIILLVGVLGVLGALVAARHLLKKSRTGRVASLTTVRMATTNSTGAVVVAAAARVFGGFSVSPITIEKTPGSTLAYASGTLKNETDRQRFEVTIELDLFNSSGVKAGSAKDYAAVMEPRAEWKFRALLIQRNISSARVANVHEK